MSDGYSKPIRILVADDEDKILEMYQNIFTARGKQGDTELSLMENELFGEAHQVEEDAYAYELTLCKQGDEAVEKVREAVETNNPYALAVLDIRMPPGPNGVWTAEQVRKLDPHINILIVTGYSDFDPEEIARLVPPVDKILYVHKPLHPGETRAFTTAICAKWISETTQRDVTEQLETLAEEQNVKLNETNQRLEMEIQAREQQQHALEKSEQYLKTLLNSVRCGILVVEADSLEIKDANPFAMEVLGAEQEEDVIGCPCPLFLSLEADANAETPEPEDSESTQHVSEGALRTIRGETLQILKSVAPLETSSETLLIVSFIDITQNKQAENERERLEEQLRQAQKMEAIGQLAGGTAHDFNNILQAILGHADLILDRLDEQPELLHSVQQIKTASMRAAELVQQILTFSRHSQSDFQLLPMQQVIKETIKLLRATLPSTITINTDVDERCTPIKADWTEMQQLLLNLCTNAHQAMLHSGGTLTLTLKDLSVDESLARKHMDLKCGDYVHLMVKDTGVGMKEETVKRVFDPYFTTKGLGRGTGLGLSTVYGIVQNVGGAIHVESKEGQGAKFDIYLPIAVEEEGETAKPTTEANEDAEPERGDEELILFVDDEEMLVEIGIKRLGRLGYKVKGFSKSREALEFFQMVPNEVDLIITDQTMPGMTGADLTQEVKKVRADLPIILCTGFSETIDESTALAMGINAYLHKPVSDSDLIRAISKALKKSKVVSP